MVLAEACAAPRQLRAEGGWRHLVEVERWIELPEDAMFEVGQWVAIRESKDGALEVLSYPRAQPGL